MKLEGTGYPAECDTSTYTSVVCAQLSYYCFLGSEKPPSHFSVIFALCVLPLTENNPLLVHVPQAFAHVYPGTQSMISPKSWWVMILIETKSVIV